MVATKSSIKSKNFAKLVPWLPMDSGNIHSIRSNITFIIFSFVVPVSGV